MGITKKERGKVIGRAFQADVFLARQAWVDAVAADPNGLLDDHDLDTAAHTVSTFLGQPDYARNVTLVASGATTDNVVVHGTDIAGNVISETIALNGTSPVAGTKAFASITSMDVPEVASVTLDAGWGDVLGLRHRLAEASVLFLFAGGTDELSSSTVVVDGSDVSENTVDPNTALDATTDFVAIYATTDKGGLA